MFLLTALQSATSRFLIGNKNRFKRIAACAKRRARIYLSYGSKQVWSWAVHWAVQANRIGSEFKSEVLI
jgi:hypothetical protein